MQNKIIAVVNVSRLIPFSSRGYAYYLKTFGHHLTGIPKGTGILVAGAGAGDTTLRLNNSGILATALDLRYAGLTRDAVAEMINQSEQLLSEKGGVFRRIAKKSMLLLASSPLDAIVQARQVLSYINQMIRPYDLFYNEAHLPLLSFAADFFDHPARYKAGDIMRLPFNDNSFDLSVSNDLIFFHFLRDWDKLIFSINELIRVTVPGGKILIAPYEPGPDAPLNKKPENELETMFPETTYEEKYLNILQEQYQDQHPLEMLLPGFMDRDDELEAYYDDHHKAVEDANLNRLCSELGARKNLSFSFEPMEIVPLLFRLVIRPG